MATSRGARHRKFYSLPAGEEPRGEEGGAGGGEQLAEYISENIIGADTTFLSPFGRRRVVYCDYTASGRSLAFIEQFITAEVLPMYGNTHTTTSVTSLQSTLYRHEARDIVRSACGAGEQDAVIFTGSGCTGAVQCLVSALGLRQEEQVTVLVGPLEHHSNLLPWRESGARVVAIRPDPATGRTDLGHLAQELARLQHQGTVIGCFSAASNVTGLLEDDLAVTALLHTYGALAFWDYAAAAPYVSIQMNPKVPEDTDGRCYKDAIYFSTHKFVGGVQTPGVLVAKKTLFRNPVPNGPGGGTVFYVTESDHRYLQEPEVREEGGTPAIVESVRAGLVLKLKAAAGPEQIMAREEELRAEALAAWGHLDNLVLLGPGHGPALPIFSFLVRHPATGLFLHHNYVVALLNDLFGIQARGGCACAGPYMQRLLGLDLALVRRFEAVLVEDSRLDRVGLRRGHMEHGQWEVLRPGATRLNIPWFAPREEVDFILKAVKMVAEEGWKLLPLYRFNNETGEWRHSSNSVFKDRRWLGHVTFTSGRMQFAPPSLPDQGAPPDSLSAVLAAGRATIDSAARLAARETVPDQTAAFSPEAAALRWFLTPSEAAACLLPSLTTAPALQPPFSPPPHHAPASEATPRIGSLFGLLQLQPATSSLISSSLARGTVRQSIRRARPSPPSALPTSHSVTVNGATSVTVIAGGGEAGTGVTVNGFKSVISVSSCDISQESFENNFANGEAGQMTFEEEAGSDLAPAAKSDGASKACCDSSESVPAASSESVQPASACEGGVCQLPEGGRTEPAASLGSARWRVPSKEIFRSFLEAVTEFSMVKDGDRLLVCLSGGKDSLSLLHCVRQYQFQARKQGINFEFGAVTVDPMSSGYDPRPLVPYLRQLGVPYLYEQQDIMAQALESQCSSICSFCSRMKRGRIYAAARREGYNVLAMGQHLDDLAESFLMSVFHNGRLRTMKAAYSNKESDLRVIRPLVYTRERSLRNFAESSGLPVIAENCPACFEAPKERQRMKQLLAQQELLFPRLYWNLKAALYPVMRIDRTGLESLVFGKGNQEEEEEEEEM